MSLAGDPGLTTFAVAASLSVALVSLVMAYLAWKSYRVTANPRLVFVVLAFAVFVAKSVFVAYNVRTHVVPHDAIEFFSAVFDLGTVALLFIPFVMANPR